MLSDCRCLAFWEDQEFPFLETDSPFTSQGLKGDGSTCLSFEEASLVLGRSVEASWREGVEGGGIFTLSSLVDPPYLLSLRNSLYFFFILSLCTCIHLSPAQPRHFRSPEKDRRPMLNGQRIT